jgi:hypothetical protein
MSVENYDLTRTWNRLYPWRIDHGSLSDHPAFRQTVGYSRTGAYHQNGPSRSGLLDWHIHYWETLTGPSGITVPTTANVLFVGAGFGWLGEAARGLGWDSLAFVDDSNWIAAHKNDLGWRWNGSAWVEDTPNAVEDILQRGLSPANSLKNTLKGIFTSSPGDTSGEPDLIVTESVVSGLLHPSMGANYQEDEGDSDELTPFFGECDAVIDDAGTVLHMADTTTRVPYNVLSLAEWKALRPAHSFAPSGPYSDFEIL